MGMRDEIQEELAAAFDDDLADAVNEFDGLYVIQGEWDPITETGGETQVTYTGRGVLDSYSLDRIDGVNILSGDMLLIALKNEVTDKPRVDHTITTIDLVTELQQQYKVISVNADPAQAHYELQLRRK